MTGTRNAGGTSDADNNTDGKKSYAKASYSTYNIAGANVDADTAASATSDTGEKVSNNTNNIGES